MAYDYEKKYLWDIDRVWNIGGSPISLRNRTPITGSPGFDMDRYIDSPYGEKTVEQMENFIKYTDEMDPALVEHYRSIGLKKELMQADDFYERWSLYTPLSMYEQQNSGRKYPFLFVLHGASMPIDWEECSGFLPLAARDEVIVVSAQNHNEDNLIRILGEVMAKHPVDGSRIYCTGYSQGGFKTNNVTLKHPEVFAACAPCGMHYFPPDTVITDGDIENMRKYDLPVISISGMQEFLYIFPLVRGTPIQKAEDGTPLPQRNRHAGADPRDKTLSDLGGKGLSGQPDEKLELLNRRLCSMRCREDITMDMCEATKEGSDKVEKNLGFPCDRSEIIDMLGVEHYAADFKNDDGNYYLRFIGIDNMPHWPPPTMAELAWNFMKRFARNVETKELIEL